MQMYLILIFCAWTTHHILVLTQIIIRNFPFCHFIFICYLLHRLCFLTILLLIKCHFKLKSFYKGINQQFTLKLVLLIDMLSCIVLSLTSLFAKFHVWMHISGGVVSLLLLVSIYMFMVSFLKCHNSALSIQTLLDNLLDGGCFYN